MRLVCCSVDYKPNSGGVAEFAYCTSAALQQLGHEVVFIAPAMDGGDTFDQQASALETVRTGERITPWSLLSWKNLPLRVTRIVTNVREFRRLAHLFQTQFNGPIDAVLCFHWDVFGAVAYLLWRSVGVPYWVVCYGKEISASRWAFSALIQRIILRRAAVVICISDYTRERVLRSISPDLNTVVSYVGVDSSVYRPAAVSTAFAKRYDTTGRRIILTVARLIERKGIDRSIRAFSEYLRGHPETRMEYWIAGDGPQLSDLRRLATTLGVASHVRFLGHVSDRDKIELYNAAEIFLMTPRQLTDGDAEGFGIVYLEANCCQKAVIAGRTGGVPDAVEEGVNGFLVDSDDVGGIAGRIAALVDSPLLAQEMGSRGRGRAIARFSWEHVAKRILSAS